MKYIGKTGKLTDQGRVRKKYPEAVCELVEKGVYVVFSAPDGDMNIYAELGRGSRQYLAWRDAARKEGLAGAW